MKKAEILDRLRAQLCPEQVNKIFFFGTRQSFYRRRKSFQTLCLFSFFVRIISLFAASSLAEKSRFPNFFRLFSCQISAKTKRAATFKFLFSRTFASPLLKQFLSSFNSLNFYVSGAETCRSRFSKSFFRGDLSRRRSVDNLNFQNLHTNLHSG